MTRADRIVEALREVLANEHAAQAAGIEIHGDGALDRWAAERARNATQVVMHEIEDLENTLRRLLIVSASAMHMLAAEGGQAEKILEGSD